MDNNFDYSTSNTKKLILMIEKEIELDINKSKIMLRYLDKDVNPNVYLYLNGMIREKEIYSKYDTNMKEKYNKYLNKGKIYLKNKKYSQAYKAFTAGYSETKNNIFNYYMGKSLFKNRHYEKAFPYFTEYIKLGGSKLPKVLLYTIYEYIKLGDENKAREYYTQLKDFNKIFNNGFILTSPFETDFTDKGKFLDIKKYYDYGFDEKILLIESLFREGNYKVAIKLLNELKPTDKNQRKQIQKLEKNKVLYKNKTSN